MSKTTKMESGYVISGMQEGFGHGQYISQEGVHVVKINGQDMISVDDINRLVMQHIERMPKQAAPTLKQAQEYREAVEVLFKGIGGVIENFESTVKVWLNDIRQSRYAVVSEAAQMTSALKDVRAFLVGPTHDTEMARLRDFVELCERLKALKDCGFLDVVADTIIRLDNR